MSFVARLQREIKANPAKGAGLGVLVLVAAYFWLPLLRGWFWPESPEAEVPLPPVASGADAAVKPANATNVTAPASPAVGGATKYDWRKHARALDSDPNMRSADGEPPRDPFAAPITSALTEPGAESQAQAAQAEAAGPLPPEEAGLVLTTTFLGQRRKIAEIGGETYSVGDSIDVTNDERQESYRVLAIYPRRVVLENRGRQFELRIPRPLIDSVEEMRTGQQETADDGEELTEENLFAEPPAIKPSESPVAPQELTE